MQGNRVNRRSHSWEGSRLSRRDWLRGTLAAAGAGLLGGSVWPQDAPQKKSALIVHTENPFNAETSLDRLLEHWLTPVEDFYVRDHAPRPQVDLEGFRVSIEGLVERPQSFTLAELTERFPAAEVTATLCCAGNRRVEFNRTRPVEGVPWGAGALGNARWGGVRLRDVLEHVGLRPEARHVWFEGLDRHEKHGHEIVFGGSVPLERVWADDPAAAVLLAQQMNGAPLTPEHGAPLRSLTPGYIGARSVKWLSRIIVSDRPSDNYYVADAYRLATDETPEALRQAEILYELPLQSVIASVAVDRNARRPRLIARGYAMPSGRLGQRLRFVEVSPDGGETWSAAQLEGSGQPYCWQFWRAELRIGRRTPSRLLVRAISSDWEMQPQQAVWNPKGYMYNGWHAVELSST